MKLIGVPYEASGNRVIPGTSRAPFILDLVMQDCEMGGFDHIADLPSGLSSTEMMEQYIAPLAKKYKRSVYVGGDHTMTYGIIDALRDKSRPLTVLQIDAHDDGGNGNLNHATWLRHLDATHDQIEFIVLGQRTETTATGFRNLVRFGSTWDLAERFLDTQNHPFYLTIDIDGFDASVAPAVSYPQHGGLPMNDKVHTLLASLAESKLCIGADVVEYNPMVDMHNLTARFVTEVIASLL